METPFPLSLPDHPPALLLVISGPSGVGKSALCELLVKAVPGLVQSVSATTRPPRGDEVEGEDYFFTSEKAFRKGVADGEFLEWAEVYGHLYGTPREPIRQHMTGGRTPVLNVDLQGGHSVKKLMPEAVLVFLVPPDLGALESRLRGRGTDTEEEIAGRLRTAVAELGQAPHYDYMIRNDALEDAVTAVAAVIAAERHHTKRIFKSD